MLDAFLVVFNYFTTVVWVFLILFNLVVLLCYLIQVNDVYCVLCGISSSVRHFVVGMSVIV